MRQPLIVDVELTLDLVQFHAEDILGTVDYTRVANKARDIADHHTDLIETFAERLAERCLVYPLVSAARIQIEKPRAVPAAIAGVKIVRCR